MEDEVLGLYGLDASPDPLRCRPGEPLGDLPPMHQFTGQWRRNWTVPARGLGKKGPWVWSGKWGYPVVTPGLSGLDDDAYGFFPAFPAIAAGVAAAVKGGKAIHDAAKRSPKERAAARARGRRKMLELQRKLKRAKRAERRRRRRLLAQEKAIREGRAREARQRTSKLQADPVLVEREIHKGVVAGDVAARRPDLLRIVPRAGVIQVPRHVLAPPAPVAADPWYKQPIAGGMPTGVAMGIGVAGVALLLLLTRGR